MIILFLLFLIQFSIACACLAVSKEQQVQFAEQGWKAMDNTTKEHIQDTNFCCGVYNSSNRFLPGDDPFFAPPCHVEVRNIIHRFLV